MGHSDDRLQGAKSGSQAPRLRLRLEPTNDSWRLDSDVYPGERQVALPLPGGGLERSDPGFSHLCQAGVRCDLKRLSFKGSLDGLHHFADAIYATHRKPRKQPLLFDALVRTIASVSLTFATGTQISPFFRVFRPRKPHK
jgi:hypothetical protein